MRYKIVIDSCGELLDEWKQDEHFESVPLTLMVGAEQIIDDETFKQGVRSAQNQHVLLRRDI